MSEGDSDEGGEKVVLCPIEGCDAEQLARGIHLHILQSSGGGHGEQGDIPPGVTLDDLDEVGRQSVDVNYPDERETEAVARICPYCGRPFKGKNGVSIHLGLVAGRKDHPPNASALHEPADFPVVEVDDDENVVADISSQQSAVPDTETGHAEMEDDDYETAFVEFSKSEMDSICEAIKEAELEDERAVMLLRRP